MPEQNTDQRTLDFVLECYKYSRTASQDIRDQYDQDWKYYMSYRDPNIYQWRSNLFIPWIFQCIESITPHLVNTVLGVDPPISALPRGVNGYLGAKVFEYLFAQQCKQNNTFTKAVIGIKDSKIFGKSVWFVPWRYEPGSFDCWDIIPLDPYNCRPDLRFDTIERMQFFQFKDYIPLARLQRAAELGLGGGKKYKNLNQLTKTKNSWGKENQMAHLKRQQLVGLSPNVKSPESQPLVEIIHHWEDDRWIQVANRAVVVFDSNDSQYPYQRNGKPTRKPLIDITPIPIPHQWQGFSVPKLLGDLQEELNDKRNQRLDNVRYLINKMWLVARGAGIDIDRIISQPYGIIETNDMNAMKDVSGQDVTQSAVREEAMVKGDMEETMGNYKNFRGADPEQFQTATTTTSLQSMAGSRFGLEAQLIEKSVAKLAEMALERNLQFMDKRVPIRMTEDIVEFEGLPDYEKVGAYRFFMADRNIIDAEYDIEPVGSASDPMANSQTRVMLMNQTYNLIAQEAFVNRREFVKEIFAASKLRNPKLLMPEQMPMLPGLGITPGGQSPYPGAVMPAQSMQAPTNDAEMMQAIGRMGGSAKVGQ